MTVIDDRRAPGRGADAGLPTGTSRPLSAPSPDSGVVARVRQAVRRPPLASPATGALWLAAGAAAAAVLLPPAYLAVRAAGADAEAWSAVASSRTLASLGRTLGLAAAVTGACTALALPLAWLTVRTDLPWRRGWSVVLALPLVIPSYVGAYLIVAALGPRGMLHEHVAEALGVARLPSLYGFGGASMALTLFTYPYAFLLLRAALLRVDPALEAASRTLGASPLRTALHITFPQLRPALATGGLLTVLYTLRDFGAVSVMRYDTLTRVIYLQYQSAFDRHAAALVALVLVAVTAVILVAERRAEPRARYHAPGAHGQRPARPVRLGRWRWPALALCAGVATLAVGLPAVVLGHWLLRGIHDGIDWAALVPAARDSLTAAGWGAAATTALALPVAWLAVRRPGRASGWLLRLTWLSHALPGVVVALALVFFGIRVAPALYQTMALLVLAYAVLHLPQAVGAVRTSLMQVHPSLEEAARMLGRPPGKVAATVTLPLVAPGVAAGAALVFLTVMKELPATLMLGPLGFATLATGVWSAVSEAFFARAAAPALLLVLLSSVPTAVLLAHERVEQR